MNQTMLKFYCLFFLLLSCQQVVTNNKVASKKLDMVFDVEYNYDSLIFFINDSMLVQAKIKTDPSTGIALSQYFYSIGNQINVKAILNGDILFDSAVSVENFSSFFFSYDKKSGILKIRKDKHLYMFD